MKKGFNIIALDENYQIVALLSYTNLQWNRKYYEPGSFSLEIPLEQYSSKYKYIYTKDRPEMGTIEQVNYIDQKGFRAVYLSGYFLEHELNDHIVYRKSVSNILGGPEWVTYKGNAEDVAFELFNSFKDITVKEGENEIIASLQIESGENLSRGKISEQWRCGEYLGNKIYSTLKPSEMSYRVGYNFEDSKKIFSVWTGLDRTQDQTENNPITFSTRYGNIKNPNILIDKVNYRNACIVDNESENAIYSQAVITEKEENDPVKFCYLQSTVLYSDFSSEDKFIEAMRSEGRSELNDCIKTVNVEFDAMEGSYEYMEDFDIGDKCNVEIPEMEISANAVLIGCYEVIKKGIWSLTLEFGTPVMKRG
ncbi:MAG: hypothetical protein IKW30_03635 [Lachnospiraceae bacterium]|nr:hypothetical protein [Lachnospiraceae bacterium]